MQRKLTSAEPPAAPQVLDRIFAALDGLRYGTVEITVHEGKVMQIERREKFRFPVHASSTGSSSR